MHITVGQLGKNIMCRLCCNIVRTKLRFLARHYHRVTVEQVLRIRIRDFLLDPVSRIPDLQPKFLKA
jgi:hypothetical protein